MVNKVINKALVIGAYSASVTLVLASLVFAFTALVPVDVIKGWTIQTQKDTYQTGEEAVMQSRLTKVMSVEGDSHRYLVCTINGTEQRFDINAALANRPEGTRVTELRMVIPQNVPNLPQTCHFNITVQYYIYGYRSHTETVDSNDFTLIEGK